MHTFDGSYGEFHTYSRENKASGCFISKPEAGAQGKGISLVRSKASGRWGRGGQTIRLTAGLGYPRGR